MPQLPFRVGPTWAGLILENEFQMAGSMLRRPYSDCDAPLHRQPPGLLTLRNPILSDYSSQERVQAAQLRCTGKKYSHSNNNDNSNTTNNTTSHSNNNSNNSNNNNNNSNSNNTNNNSNETCPGPLKDCLKSRQRARTSWLCRLQGRIGIIEGRYMWII